MELAKHSSTVTERIARYFGIPGDMYTFGGLFGTGTGGTTYSGNFLAEFPRYVSKFGLQSTTITEPLTIPLVKQYVDKGLPIIWAMEVNPGNPKSGHMNTIVGYNETKNEVAVSDTSMWIERATHYGLESSKQKAEAINWITEEKMRKEDVHDANYQSYCLVVYP